MLTALTHAGAVWRLMGDRQLGLIAAGVGFFSLMAIFPAVATLIALVGFWADPAIIREALDLLSQFLPEEAFVMIADQIDRMTSAPSQTLGLTSVISLLVALWSARLGVGALFQGMTAIYGASPRHGARGIALALFMTVLLILVGVIAVAAMLVTPVLLALIGRFLPGGSTVLYLAEVLRWVVALFALLVGLGLFYRYGPNRPKAERSAFFSPGLFLALFLWGAASAGFSIFLANFGNYNEVYGSIGAVIALLMWFYISAYAVLIGAALNYTLEKQTRAAQAPTSDQKSELN